MEETKTLNGFTFKPYDDETLKWLLEHEIKMYERRLKRENIQMTRNEILINIQTDIDDLHNTGGFDKTHHENHARLQDGQMRTYYIINELLKDQEDDK